MDYKLCTGPAHDKPTELPATDKYFYRHKTGERAGQFMARCRLCANWAKLKSPGESGTVPVGAAYPYFREAVNRVGIVEAARRIGVSRDTIREILNAPAYRKVQKRTLRKCMLEVISMRRKGEVRHRDSIRTGAYIRGREEKVPVDYEDLYNRHGDRETEYKRVSRAKRKLAPSSNFNGT